MKYRRRNLVIDFVEILFAKVHEVIFVFGELEHELERELGRFTLEALNIPTNAIILEPVFGTNVSPSHLTRISLAPTGSSAWQRIFTH